MNTAAIALALYLAYLAIAFGLRTWLLYRRTGTTGFHGLTGPLGSPGWWGGVGFIAALLTGLAAPILQLIGLIDPVTVLDTTAGYLIGLALTLTGTVFTLAAQQAMGQHWRVGVRKDERTELVRTGVFAVVRNPFFSGLLITATGLALLTPNLIALVALTALVTAIELQVRAVEEPYLHSTHTADYDDYAARVGRFAPRIGKLRTIAPTAKRAG